jgi:uncharacterized protein YjbJ (UPF0337 family)
MEADMDKLDIAKDKAVGKILETAGKITNDEELEFTGKFKAMTTKVKDRLYDVKEDVFQEGNRLLDKVNEKDRDKHDT